jgi:hypothetical protein
MKKAEADTDWTLLGETPCMKYVKTEGNLLMTKGVVTVKENF